MLWNVPEHDRNRVLEEHEVAAGLHWPPDDSIDHGEPFEGVPEGHGTQTAMLAGGMRTGVARRAGLYLIKAGGAVLDREDNVVEEDVCADSLVISLNHVVGKLADGSLPIGKTVILIDTRKLARERGLGGGGLTLPDHCGDRNADNYIPQLAVWDIDRMSKDGVGAEQRYGAWRGDVEQALDEIDRFGGVTVSVAAGNEGKNSPPGETGDFMPNILARREGSPLVIVGAVTRSDTRTLISPLEPSFSNAG